jgi:citrate lyase subunit beta/citryl-CoA lyase
MKSIARSFLFVPGDRPERFEKAAASGAHQLILDLEDAVAPAAKSLARDAVRAWLSAGNSAIVRINGVDTPWHQDDLAMLEAFSDAGLMLPKAEPVVMALVTARLPGRQAIALVESVVGYTYLRELAGVSGLSRLAFGSVDFSLETGIADEGDALTAVRTGIVMASVLAGLEPPIDGVSVELMNVDLIGQHALRSLRLGFGGKLCIHPKQIATVNGAFRPSKAEEDWARSVIDAAAVNGGAAFSLGGKMVDLPVVERARRIVAGLGVFA